MGTKLANLTFDRKQPLVLSAFWSQVVDLPVGEGASEFFAQLPSDNSGPSWAALIQARGGSTAMR